MTLAEAREKLAYVESLAADPEAAHGAEDELRSAVLLYLAEVAPAELAELAKIALATANVAFPRWYS